MELLIKRIKMKGVGVKLNTVFPYAIVDVNLIVDYVITDMHSVKYVLRAYFIKSRKRFDMTCDLRVQLVLPSLYEMCQTVI